MVFHAFNYCTPWCLAPILSTISRTMYSINLGMLLSRYYSPRNTRIEQTDIEPADTTKGDKPLYKRSDHSHFSLSPLFIINSGVAHAHQNHAGRVRRFTHRSSSVDLLLMWRLCMSLGQITERKLVTRLSRTRSRAGPILHCPAHCFFKD